MGSQARTGCLTKEVRFRLIMFRPFVGEVIAARLKRSDVNGLPLLLGFFDDIYIPSPLVPYESDSEKDPENP